MKLSAEQFADLAASFPGYSEEKTKHERRRAARIELRAHVAIRLMNAGAAAAPVTVTVNNFSPRGLGMLVHDPLSTGTQFVTELPRKSGGTVSFLCTVMHSRKISERLFQVGVEFTCVLRAPRGQEQAHEVADELKRIRRSMLE
jgi:c-di-GMP-binding flagellar brake protein YcgR